MKESIEAAAGFKGSPQKKLLIMFCTQLGIDYTKLTMDEFRVMTRVIEKSKHLKSHIRQRGKKRR